MAFVRYLPTDGASPEEFIATTEDAYAEAFGWNRKVFHNTVEEALRDYATANGASGGNVYRITIERV